MRSKVDDDIASVYDAQKKSKLATCVCAVVDQLAGDEVSFEGEDLTKNSMNEDYVPDINVIHVALKIP